VEPPLKCLAIQCKPGLHVQCRQRDWLCTACTGAQGQARHDANTARREEARKQQEQKKEAKKQLA
jgi:hypothetical protein